MKLGIRGKLFAISLALISGVGLAAGLYLEGELRQSVERRIEIELQRQAQTASEAVSSGKGDLTIASLDPLADRLGASMDSRVTIIGPDGRVLGDSDIPMAEVPQMSNHDTRPEVVAARSQGRGQSRRYSTTLDMDLLYMAATYARPPRIGVVRVARPLADVDHAVARLRMLLLVAGAIGLGAAIIMSGIASHLMSRALRRLADRAQVLADGSSESGAAADAGNIDELGGLAGSINRMAKSIETTVSTLAAERSRFQAVLQGMHEAVITLDDERRISMVNPAALRLLGLSETPIGEPFIDYIRVPAVQEMLHDGARASGDAAGESNVDDGRCEFVLSGERKRHVMAHITPHQYDGGTIIVMHDVSDIRRLETVRRDFVANVSHELRTPVSIIRANAETLLDGAMDDAEFGVKLLDAVHRNAERLTAIIDDLLDLSRLEVGKYQVKRAPVSVLEVTGRAIDTVEQAARARHIELVCEVDDEIVIDSDAQAIERVLVNYLDNAIKYTPEHGCVRISAMLGSSGVHVEVEDDGPGIAAHHRSRVFERFYRADPGRSRFQGGTGLGLSIVKHLADALGAEVGVDQIEPHGARFWIAFPAS